MEEKNVQPPPSSSLHELLAELSGGGVGQGAEGPSGGGGSARVALWATRGATVHMNTYM